MKSAGFRLQALRKTYIHNCQRCDKKFEAIITAKYCSEACKSAAKRMRKAAADSDA